MGYTATDSMNLGFATKPIGRALEVECPRCESAPNDKCINIIEREGSVFPLAVTLGAPHVERGRLARWVEMLHL